MNRRRNPLLSAASLVVLVACLAACDVAFQGTNASATDEWKKTYTLGPGGRFELSDQNGTIDISPSADATTVEVVATRRVRASSEQAAKEQLKAIEIGEQANASEVRLEVKRTGQAMGFHLGSSSPEVNFTVKVPKGTSVKVDIRNGTVHLAQLAGSVKVETTNGVITGENLAGPLDAGTTNGRIDIQLAAVAPEGVRLDTTNGEISLRMPADTKATIAARWTHGSFDVSGLKPEGGLGTRRYDGRLNGGGARIELSTVNGGIRISS